jgi:hypothetical protein
MGAVIVTANRAVLGLAEGQPAEVEHTEFIQAHIDAGLLRLAEDVPAEQLPVTVLALVEDNGDESEPPE